MKNPIVKWGVYYGVASSILTFALYLIKKDLLFNVPVASGSGLVLSIIFLVMAMKEVRTENDGYLSYGEAVKTGLLTFLVGAFISIIFSFVLYNVIDPSLYDLEKQKTIEMTAGMADRFGIDEDMKEEMITQAEEQVAAMGDSKGFGDFFLTYLLSAIWGLILSLIVGAFMKKSS